jgi:hypothetical protein
VLQYTQEYGIFGSKIIDHVGSLCAEDDVHNCVVYRGEYIVSPHLATLAVL